MVFRFTIDNHVFDFAWNKGGKRDRMFMFEPASKRAVNVIFRVGRRKWILRHLFRFSYQRRI